MPELGESIILTHWGLVRPEIGCSWVERLQSFGHCLEREDPSMTDPRQSMPCYVPGKVTPKTPLCPFPLPGECLPHPDHSEKQSGAGGVQGRSPE